MCFKEFEELNEKVQNEKFRKAYWYLNWWHERKCDVVEMNDAKYNVSTIEKLFKMLVAEGII